MVLTGERKAELLQKIASGSEVFFESIKKKDFEEVEFLVNNGADVNARDAFGDNPLLLASSISLDIVQLLVNKGANVNAKNNYEDKTPLHLASRLRHFDIVKFLVEKGADVNAKDIYKRTPLYIVSGFGNVDIVKFLVEKGADVNAKTASRSTPLHNAISLHNIEIVGFHVIDLYNNLDIVKFLVEKGADVNAKDNYIHTPLDIAKEKNNSDIVNILLPQPRARVIVDTPLLSRETYSAGEEGTMKYYEDIEKFTKRLECPMCMVNEKKIVFQCGHMYCNSCSERIKTIETNYRNKCPQCNLPITDRREIFYNKYLKYKNKYLALKNKNYL
jgi:ankyrin repeat protein